MKTDQRPETASATPVGSSALLAEIIAGLNTALNYWYPMRREDGDAACEARQRVFELRDKLERMSANEQAHSRRPAND